jgi:hypothetical protein
MVETAGIKLHSVTSTTINDGNLKLTLGTVWTIIHNFQIHGISVEAMSAKEGKAPPPPLLLLLSPAPPPSLLHACRAHGVPHGGRGQGYCCGASARRAATRAWSWSTFPPRGAAASPLRRSSTHTARTSLTIAS